MLYVFLTCGCQGYHFLGEEKTSAPPPLESAAAPYQDITFLPPLLTYEELRYLIRPSRVPPVSNMILNSRQGSEGVGTGAWRQGIFSPPEREE